MNTPQISRREWLVRSLTLTAGVSIMGAAAPPFLMAVPQSKAEKKFWEQWQKSTGNSPRDMKIRLTSNENPYGPGEQAIAAMQKHIRNGNRYPFGAYRDLAIKIAAKEGVKESQVLIGAGTTELLCLAGLYFGRSGGKLITADPTYPIMSRYAANFEVEWVKTPATSALGHDPAALKKAAEKGGSWMFVCNPNNPTGTYLDGRSMEDLAGEVSKKMPVYIDEAYLEYVDPKIRKSMAHLVAAGENVIVARTFSKIHALAGMRIGYIIGPEKTIEGFKKLHMHYGLMPVSDITLAAASATLDDQEFMESSRIQNERARKILEDYLDSKKIKYGKSHTSFVLFELEKMKGQDLLDHLMKDHIGVRVWEVNGKEWCRASVGTAEEMQALVASLSKVSV